MSSDGKNGELSEMCDYWFPGTEECDPGKFLFGRVKKLHKMVQRDRHTEEKFSEILVAELEELRAFEEHTQATVGNLEKHVVHVERRVRDRDMIESSRSSGSHHDIREESSEQGTLDGKEIGSKDNHDDVERGGGAQPRRTTELETNAI